MLTQETQMARRHALLALAALVCTAIPAHCALEEASVQSSNKDALYEYAGMAARPPRPAWERALGLWPEPQSKEFSGELLTLDTSKLSVKCAPKACDKVLQDAVSR